MPGGAQRDGSDGRESDRPGRCNVLVVDDDPILLTIAVKLLKTLGYATTTLTDGRRVAEEIARATEAHRPVGLVLIDLQLGEPSGLDVCKNLRSAGVEACIVYMSGDIASVDARALREAGFDGALGKPFSLDELRACVDRYARAP